MIVLFRAVTQIERADIRSRAGLFRDSPHQSGEKGFFFEKESAVGFARNAYGAEGVEHFIVRTEVPAEVIDRGRPHSAAGEGSGVYLAAEDLEFLAPAVEVGF